MEPDRLRPITFLSAITVWLLLIVCAPLHVATATPKHATPDAGAEGGDSGATILVLVNDAPITAYSVDQRIKLMSLEGSSGWQQRLQAKLKAPDLQERFKAFAIAHHPRSKEEVLALQKQFVEGLRQQAISEVRPGLRDKAAAMLIEETIEMQEAKRQSVLASDADVTGAVADIAKRNKKTAKEFEAAISATSVSFRAFKERIRAQMSWQRVIESHFRGQIIVGQTELNEEVAGAAAAAGAPTAVQLRLQRIVIPQKGSDAAASVSGYAAADQLRQQAKPCGNMADLAKTAAGAHFEDMGMVSTDNLPAEARPVLTLAQSGSVPPPVITKTGIEIYGVCERGAASAGESAKASARDKIEHEKLIARSHALLNDLCAAAQIEPRNGFTLAKPCGSD